MSVGRFIGCLIIAVMFGILGIFDQEGFFNAGFFVMIIMSIPSLFVGIFKNE